MTSLCKQAGVRQFKYQALSHFGASLLDQANIPIGVIQKLLGHENRSATEIYLHTVGKSEHEAIGILDGIVR